MYSLIMAYSRSCIVVICILISGCASLFSDKPFPPSNIELRAPNLTAAYNKPYTIFGVTYYPLKSAKGYREIGYASWYGSESGNRTSMGMRFVPDETTAAHKTLPLPSRVRVTNLQNGLHVDVVVNDRGPFKKDRVIDLSRGAAKKIGLSGVTKVKIEHLGDK
ncbi:MAG: septal ring lytic transglycosylase RlpA family protein [Nitrosomonas sp.]|jgi:rare lipoprotein A